MADMEISDTTYLKVGFALSCLYKGIVGGQIKSHLVLVTQMAFIVCDYRLADGWVANPYVG